MASVMMCPHSGGTHLSNHQYSACIRGEQGYCSIAYSSCTSTRCLTYCRHHHVLLTLHLLLQLLHDLAVGNCGGVRGGQLHPGLRPHIRCEPRSAQYSVYYLSRARRSLVSGRDPHDGPILRRHAAAGLHHGHRDHGLHHQAALPGHTRHTRAQCVINMIMLFFTVPLLLQ